MAGVSEEESDESAGFLTARLILRRPAPADAETGGRIAGNPRAAGPASLLVEDITDARGFLARARLAETDSVYSIFEAASGALVGAVGIAPMAGYPERLEINAWIGEPFAGRGYGTEAAQAAIDRLFLLTPVETLWGVCRVTNRRGRRLVEKCGFQYRENGMARSVALRGAVAVERFALERRTWIALKAWAAAAGTRQQQAEAGFAA